MDDIRAFNNQIPFFNLTADETVFVHFQNEQNFVGGHFLILITQATIFYLNLN